MTLKVSARLHFNEFVMYYLSFIVYYGNHIMVQKLANSRRTPSGHHDAYCFKFKICIAHCIGLFM